ncbi:MAG: hypothetical protein AUH81_15190 [Candidatus Rokubacteria bacterium 13_1_40CM_4_69_5]|nr:MAG: hypothetical protein AUH81_15190 [Candidatus Rokubacteria bacterium 13_1_40CM_4_69_5]OLE39217.1 MAG: hypothetical protein AUG00_03120 [Candidatus Rokubacteria bacterium 13_1_20CM_2_70_7]
MSRLSSTTSTRGDSSLIATSGSRRRVGRRPISTTMSAATVSAETPSKTLARRWISSSVTSPIQAAMLSPRGASGQPVK